MKIAKKWSACGSSSKKLKIVSFQLGDDRVLHLSLSQQQLLAKQEHPLLMHHQLRTRLELQLLAMRVLIRHPMEMVMAQELLREAVEPCVVVVEAVGVEVEELDQAELGVEADVEEVEVQELVLAALGLEAVAVELGLVAHGPEVPVAELEAVLLLLEERDGLIEESSKGVRRTSTSQS